MKERVYTMGARAVSAEQTGTRILDAMLAQFGELPYDQVHLEEVAAAADVTVQTVLRRFGNKAGVMGAMVDRELARIAASRRASTSDNPAEIIDELVTHYEAYGTLILKVYGEARMVQGLAPTLDEGRKYHLTWCRRTFERHLDPNLDAITRERRLAQITAACDATTWRILRMDSHLDTEQTCVALVELITPLLGRASNPT